MRYAILGDIHANFQALEAVASALEDEAVDRVVSVGDVVGYGADPALCIALLRDLKASVVAGNHDWAAIGRLEPEFFNPYARAAIEWTAATLTTEEKAWLAALPLVAHFDNEVSVVHATVESPERFDYIQSYYDAARSLNAMSTPVCFSGHSHVPLAFVVRDALTFTLSPVLDLKGSFRALINVGSIGQPRDENPKAAYAIYDSTSQAYTLKRVAYSVQEASARIRAVGLPAVLGERLLLGR